MPPELVKCLLRFDIPKSHDPLLSCGYKPFSILRPISAEHVSLAFKCLQKLSILKVPDEDPAITAGGQQGLVHRGIFDVKNDIMIRFDLCRIVVIRECINVDVPVAASGDVLP
jgi:hypothetical protein